MTQEAVESSGQVPPELAYGKTVVFINSETGRFVGVNPARFDFAEPFRRTNADGSREVNTVRLTFGNRTVTVVGKFEDVLRRLEGGAE